MHTAATVELDDVTVSYGRQVVLQEVSARFEPGAVGLLGPNGAGKSTLLRTLLGFITPDSGRARVLGIDVATAPRDVRARIGYVPESDAFIPGMTAVAFVGYCGQLAGLPAADAMQRAHEVLQYVGLGEARYRNLETYSSGMKQRIKLAQALVHDPDLLFLDEPTNGMDPRGRDDMLALIRDLATSKGVNLILSSHLLPDVEYTCEHVIVLDQGRVVANGPIDALKRPEGQVYEVRVRGDRSRFLEGVAEHGVHGHVADVDTLRLFVPEAEGPKILFQVAAASGMQVRHLRPSVPTLEDVFARAVGEQTEPAVESGRPDAGQAPGGAHTDPGTR